MQGSRALGAHVISEIGLNSTNELLGSSEKFTGTWESVTAFTSVTCSITSSIVSKGDLYFDLSPDHGATFITIENEILDASDTPPIAQILTYSHFRLRYVNGTTPQTGSFSISTKYANGQSIEGSGVGNGSGSDSIETVAIDATALSPVETNAIVGNDLLKEILMELKKHTLHFEKITDEEF